MAENWNIRIITDWDEIYSSEFQSQWLLWVENAVNSHIFFHPVMVAAWIKAYSKIWEMKPLFVLAENEETTIFYPLVQLTQGYRSFFRKIIAPVGYSSFDYSDPLVLGHSEKLHSDFFEILIKELRAFNFDLLKLKGLHTILPADLLKCTCKEMCYFNNLLSLKENVNSLLFQMSPKNRSEHLRVERRIKELGEITFKVVRYDSINLKFELQEFIKNYKKRWPGAYFAPDFHESLVRNGIKENMVWFSLLKLDHKSIGWAIDLVWKNRCYAYMHAYDREFVSYAPGRTHLMQRIKQAHASGLEFFDLLSGSETYKSEWFNEFVYIYNYETYSEGIYSRLKNQLNDLKGKIKR